MSPLIGPQQIATALRAVGLDDDAARLAAWADPARREPEPARPEDEALLLGGLADEEA